MTLVTANPKSQSEIDKGIYYEFKEKKTVKILVDNVEVEKEVDFMDYDKATVYDPSVQYYMADTNVVECGTSFSQTLPLEGQAYANSKGPRYEYRVRARAINGLYSEWSDIVPVEALVTNIRDIVKANATAKQQYVENLSAISANLGEISQGSLNGDDYNYWTLSTKDNPQEDLNRGNRDFQGAFRVGDDKYFLQVVPTEIDPVTKQPKSADIKFQIGSFTVTSQETKINNVLYLYETTGSEAGYHKKRLKIDHQGMVVQLNNGTSDEDPNSDWVTAGQMILDTNGNLIVSNTDETDPDYPRFRTAVLGSSVYHLDYTLTDEKGLNPEDFVFESEKENPFVVDATSPITESVALYNGKISKDVSSVSNDMAFLCKQSSVRIGDDVITESPNTKGNYNSLNKAIFGNEDLPSDLFKYKE